MDKYLADPSVVEALHVKANVGGMTYHKTVGNLIPLYTRLVQKYRTLIYRQDSLRHLMYQWRCRCLRSVLW